MSNKQGEFIWYELMTTDIESARSFYGAVLGWSMNDRSDMPGTDYRIARTSEADIAGFLQLDDAMVAGGARPIWMGYIGVDDVDATADEIPSMGGTIHIPPQDIPGVGRFAMAADPHGAPFYIMRGSVEGGVSTSFLPDKMGHCAWNELTSPDQKTALNFYSSLFGWTNPTSMPMGPNSFYRFLFVDDLRIGASNERADQPAEWLFYFNVPSVSAAMQTVSNNGGQITSGPHDIPGDAVIAIGTDPQGARFAVVGPG